MDEILPGTTLALTLSPNQDAFDAILPIFAVSGGGLMLSQVAEMTGLGPSTIQNWVKRGWVAHPNNKKYDEHHVARILLINLLRDTMKLEDIVRLLEYINGNVEDRSDDIIEESQLYNLLFGAIKKLESRDIISLETIPSLTSQLLKNYKGPVSNAKSRLSTTLSIMLYNITASNFMNEAIKIFDKHINKN